MRKENYSGDLAFVDTQLSKEKKYWLKKFSGHLKKVHFPYDCKSILGNYQYLKIDLFTHENEIFSKIIRLSNDFNPRIHMILVTALLILLHQYTNSEDIIIGMPIYKQEKKGKFINTVLALRNKVNSHMTFKELLLQVSHTIEEAVKYQSYPIERLIKNLNLSEMDDIHFPLFDTALLLTNIHDINYIEHIKLNLIFSFHRTENSISVELKFNKNIYFHETIQRLINGLRRVLENGLNNINKPIFQIDPLTKEEREKLLFNFNQTIAEKNFHGSINEIIETQVEKAPANIAILGENLSYQKINQRANQLASYLKQKGFNSETVIGILLEPSSEMIIGLLGIMKAGCAYLPIDIGIPEDRIRFMLSDSGADALISTGHLLKDLSFTGLQGFEKNKNIEIKKTLPRPHISEFDKLPRPDRRLINMQKYKDKIGMASVTNCISFQATRGCPYHCLFCHKIWSKHHVYRSAENIFNEIKYYNQQGVTNFAFIDDCFNLNIERSRRVFELIRKNKLQVQLFFPNGLRGDIMTPDYIDLMVEAGTRGINLSLESASPRFQRVLKKNLNLEKFKEVVDYIAGKHPKVILEMASMHGFPTETEDEAKMTLDFIKSIQWLHFPYIHILKIFPNTEMEEFALENGVSKRDILLSRDRAFHELPETLPFPKSFTRKYQADFLNNYFLNKERLLHVLPHQMKILSESALVQKYNAYLPVDITKIQDIVEFAKLDEFKIPENYGESNDQKETKSIFDCTYSPQLTIANAKKILLLDLSQHFSSHNMLYRVMEQPLGLISLLTYLKKRFDDKINGRIYKSGVDFDSYEELKRLVLEFKPDLIGIRTLTFFKEFFHETISLIRQWGIKAPIITGGPYASSDYNAILMDSNVDLVVLGEGEYTLAELVELMLKNDFLLPSPGELEKIKGIAFRVNSNQTLTSRDIILLNQLTETINKEQKTNIGFNSVENRLAYVMYTSGSTGKPKGVMIEHNQVNNCISWMQNKFKLYEQAVFINRTNLSFDPSVWEIFWPLYIGAKLKILDQYQRKDANFLIGLMSEENDCTIMYCPSTLVSIITSLLKSREPKVRLKLPWLIIGAEPITVEVIKILYDYLDGNIVNTYGPTECTINNTWYDIKKDNIKSIIPIGKPVSNNCIYILNKYLNLVPFKVPGEIYIGGESLARGYINNCDKTNVSFLKNPFGKGRIYRTGDIGRWLEDGNIEILGRIDSQVKIRGYRIELGEIESALLSHSKIDECVVVVKDSKRVEKEIKTCSSCGLTTQYPNVVVDSDHICQICDLYSQYKQVINNYFKSPEHLKAKILDISKKANSKYHCLLLYAGGRGSAYALYQLKEMGFNIMTVTYDNGYFSKADLNNIKKITESLGVDHEVLRHNHSDKILSESINTASTVCRGCFHTSSSLAAQYAAKHNIPLVIGATLSRGQIIENKLLMFLQQGITELQPLEDEIFKFQKNAPNIDKKIFDLIDIEEVSDNSIHEKVKFIDFFRYFDVSNKEMIHYLNAKNPYWKKRKEYAIYSTNCSIKQLGDFGHLVKRGYHYYGAATSWEKRLKHISLGNVAEDLQCNVSTKSYQKFLKRLGQSFEEIFVKNDKYLCAYIVSHQDKIQGELDASTLKKYLSNHLPQYMVPSFIEILENLPLTTNGKVDRSALPEPDKSRSQSSVTYVAPKSNIEKLIAQAWKEILHLDIVGTQDNFFDLGGSSMDIVMVGSKLNEFLKKEIPIVTLFTYPTINSLAQNLGDYQKNESIRNKEIEQEERLDRSRNKMKRIVGAIRNIE